MSPFAPETRKEMFRRDDGTCMHDPCIGMYIYGHPLRWDDGFNLQGTHYPHLHQKAIDYDLSHGRLGDLMDHTIEEILRGNQKGASLLWSGHTLRNYNWTKLHGYADQKPGFDVMLAFAYGDEQTRLGIGDYLRDFFDQMPIKGGYEQGVLIPKFKIQLP